MPEGLASGESAVLALRPYQEDAADFLYERDRAMVLAPVGAGKTAITLTAMEEALDQHVVKRWLVLAPKRVAKEVWPVEVAKWWMRRTVTVALGTAAQRRAAFASGCPVVVATYDNIQTMDLSSFDGVVFDELTRLKNPSGKRFKALLKQLDGIKVRWGLTGSFTANGLEDVFGQCQVIDQSLLGRTKGAFMQQYFVLLNRDYGEWVPRRGALAQVMERIKPATYLLDPGDYTDTLPPLHPTPLMCELADRTPYEAMKKDLIAEFADARIIANNAAAVTNKLQQMAGGWVYDTTACPSATPGQWTTTRNAVWFSPHKFDRLEELLAENQRANTLVVYNYQEELAELKRRYPHALTLDDADAVARWNSGAVELLLVHPKSAGHGLNLQYGGSNVVFVSLPWSLELYEQTIGRLHRSGQAHAVWVYVLLTKGTIDERIWASLHDKRALSDIAIEELRNG